MWTTKAPVPEATNSIGVGEVAGVLYVLGGQAVFATLATVEALTAPVSPLPPFTDAPSTAGSTVAEAVHFTELRQAIESLRTRYALGPFGFTDTSLAPGATLVKAVHLTELRTALSAVYTAAQRTPTRIPPSREASQALPRWTCRS